MSTWLFYYFIPVNITMHFCQKVIKNAVYKLKHAAG